jgi:hypothetical protein
MTPEEIKIESMRVLKGKEIEEVDQKVEKYMIELTILEAAENIDKYQKETKIWKDKKVVRKDSKTGDLVLKRKKNWENPGKLQEPWEGPFITKEISILGAFRLLSQTSEELSYSWNVDNLKSVTEPPKIILYYRLSLSTWPLSNNKELFCRFLRVKPGKSLTTGLRYALSPHEGGTRIQHYITKMVHKFNIITNQIFHT